MSFYEESQASTWLLHAVPVLTDTAIFRGEDRPGCVSSVIIVRPTRAFYNNK